MGANTLAQADTQSDVNTQAAQRDLPVREAIARGDLREAIGLCARLHGPTLGRLCMAMVGSQAEAQELTQETLLVAHDALRTYRGDGSVRAFLYGIARRLCSRHVEMRVRREGKLRLVHDADRDPADTGELVVLRQRAERAREALDKLRPTERDAVVLRFQGDMSFREVAEACGIDEATARKRVSRAIARLRETMVDA